MQGISQFVGGLTTICLVVQPGFVTFTIKLFPKGMLETVELEIIPKLVVIETSFCLMKFTEYVLLLVQSGPLTDIPGFVQSVIVQDSGLGTAMCTLQIALPTVFVPVTTK